MWLDRKPENIAPIDVTPIPAMKTAAILLHPMKHKAHRQHIGMTDANIVAIFRAVVVDMAPLDLKPSNVLLMKILKNHNVKNGVAV